MKVKKRLVYVPLGGAGEIGMNMYLYGYGEPGAEEYILVDAGVTFPNMDSSPGVDLIIPDASFIIRNRKRLLGIFITHAHEDHVGALGHLLESLSAPIYCREFSAQIATKKLEKAGLEVNFVHIIEPYPNKTILGPFKVSFIPISHSIPESSSLVIDNPVGRIIHTGDFKIDEDPVLGDCFDLNLFKKLKRPKVLALVCDSTNVFSEDKGRSESSLVDDFTKLLKSKKGIVVATTFASNVARLVSLAKCAKTAGRSILVLGRAMQTMISTARSAGLLHDFPPILSVEEALMLPRSNLFILATGSQGEERAVSAQLSRNKYMDISLEEGDSFLFSSKTVPGNELAVSKIINNFMERGIEVIDDQNGRYHVSGHANMPDLKVLHKIINPEIVIPMHGEARHLRAQKKLAESSGFKSYFVLNGSLLELTGDGTAKIVDQIKFGRVYYDGGKLIEADNEVIKTRLSMATRGHLSVCLIFEKNNILENGIWVKSRGLPKDCDDSTEIDTILEQALEIEISTVNDREIYNDDYLEALTQRVCNKVCYKYFGKKPVATIFINRLD